MPTFTQAGRPLKLTTPLGADALLLLGLQGSEALSELFHFELETLAPRQQPLDFNRLLGQAVWVEHRPGGEGSAARYFHGVVSRIGELGSDQMFTRYRIEVVPSLWFLSRNIQCRVFQQQSAPEILRAVFGKLDVEFRLVANYRPHN